MFNEAFRPASLSIISELVASEQLKSAFALNRMAVNLGMSVGPVVGGLLTQVSYTAIFIMDGATSILAGLVLVFSAMPIIQVAESEIAADDKHASALQPVRVLRDFRLLFFLAAMLPVELVLFQMEAAMPLFLVSGLKISETVYASLMAINTVMIIFLEVPLTLAIEGWPHRRALSIGALLFAIGFGALAIVTGIWSVGLTIMIWTFGEMILFPGASAYMGMYLMTFSIAFALAPWLGTQTLERFGSTTLWAAAFVGGCLSAVMMLMLKSKPPQAEVVRLEQPEA